MKVLVTGSTGQLGSCLKDVVDRSQNNSIEWIFTSRLELDITNEYSILQYLSIHKPDIVINCSAYTDVRRAEIEKKQCECVNVFGTATLARICAGLDIVLIHISTDFVFYGDKAPYTESDIPDPINWYGVTKLEGEKSIQYYSSKYIIIRTSWLYNLKYGNTFIIKILTGSKIQRLEVVYNEIGSPTYAVDLAEAIYHIITTNQYDKYGIYHFSNHGSCTRYDLALRAVDKYSELSHESLNFPVPVIKNDLGVRRPYNTTLNPSKFETTFGFKINYWTDSLDCCVMNYIASR